MTDELPLDKETLVRWELASEERLEQRNRKLTFSTPNEMRRFVSANMTRARTSLPPSPSSRSRSP